MQNPRKDTAEKYVKDNVMGLVQFLLSRVLYERPDDPREFMVEELKKIQFEPETQKLFGPSDVEAFFHVMDVANRGHVSLEQYKQAFKTFSVPVMNAEPEGWDDNKITKEVFVSELSKVILQKE